MRSERSSQWAFVVLVVLSLVLLAMVIAPFASALFLSAVLAGALWPWQQGLSARLRGRRNVASGLLCAAVVVALVLPIGGLGTFVIRESLAVARWVSEGLKSGGVEGVVERLPGPVRSLVEKVEEKLDVQEGDVGSEVSGRLTKQGKTAATVLGGALAATGAFVLQATMMVIALFFLLIDGKALVDWVDRISPLKEGETREILFEFRRVSVSVMVSAIATAGVQAVVALVGYLIARVPYPLFFALLTFFIAFIPAIGAAGVCVAAAVILFALGHQWAALFLALWGVLVVGLVDNVVKPLLAKRGMDMHGAVVFFALLGGLAAFGGVGLLLGPLIVSFFLALMRIQQRDRAEQAAVRPSP